MSNNSDNTDIITLSWIIFLPACCKTISLSYVCFKSHCCFVILSFRLSYVQPDSSTFPSIQNPHPSLHPQFHHCQHLDTRSLVLIPIIVGTLFCHERSRRSNYKVLFKELKRIHLQFFKMISPYQKNPN